MWIANIGKKSAAFINHKPFHPGNYQNQEKVWLAEQKQREEQKKEKELEERRREEVKIEELRRALRGEAQAALQLQKKEEQPVTPADELRQKAREAARQQALQRKQQEAQQRLKQPAKSTLYREDVFTQGHTSVFGSLYSKEEKKWGYRCCGSLEKSSACSARPVIEEPRNKKMRKNKSTDASAPDAAVSPAIPPSKDLKQETESEEATRSDSRSDVSIKNGVSENFHVVGTKKRLREGGVAAFIKLMEKTEEIE